MSGGCVPFCTRCLLTLGGINENEQRRCNKELLRPNSRPHRRRVAMRPQSSNGFRNTDRVCGRINPLPGSNKLSNSHAWFWRWRCFVAAPVDNPHACIVAYGDLRLPRPGTIHRAFGRAVNRQTTFPAAAVLETWFAVLATAGDLRVIGATNSCKISDQSRFSCVVPVFPVIGNARIAQNEFDKVSKSGFGTDIVR